MPRSSRRLAQTISRCATSSTPETTLRFALDRGASRYRAAIEDECGGSVFDAQTSEPSVRVPPGTLKPGQLYCWTVRTLDAVSVPARGAAASRTLTTDQARKRATLRAPLVSTADPRTLALLAQTDRRLGLLAEAREGLRRALEKSPDDATIRISSGLTFRLGNPGV